MGKLADAYQNFVQTPMKLERQVTIMTVIAVAAFMLAVVAIVGASRNAR